MAGGLGSVGRTEWEGSRIGVCFALNAEKAQREDTFASSERGTVPAEERFSFQKEAKRSKAKPRL